VKRATSAFFHLEVSRKDVTPTDESFQGFMTYPYSGIRDYYFSEMIYEPNDHNMTSLTGKILQSYDFIGVVERFHESLVVLKLILNLELKDILYLSAKRNGGFDDGIYHKSTKSYDEGGVHKDSCVYIVPNYISPTMQKWFDTSEEWKNVSQWDMLLFQAANKSLDMTIDSFGRDVVDQEMKALELALQLAEDKCRASTVFPCSPGGVRARWRNETSCFWWDSGCGYKCFDTLDLNEIQVSPK
jgi:hypothetical protein